jgi:acetyl esterase/lipase
MGMPLITDLAPFDALRTQPKSTPPVVWTPLDGGDPIRAQFYFYLLQTARALGVFTGVNGVAEKLVALPYEARAAAVPTEARGAIPSLDVDPEKFPPTFMLHGDRDSIVLVEESTNMERVLKEKGVEAKLAIVEGTLSFLFLLESLLTLTYLSCGFLQAANTAST